MDSLRPSHAGPELGGDLPFTDGTLDSLEQLLGSPLWSSPAMPPAVRRRRHR